MLTVNIEVIVPANFLANMHLTKERNFISGLQR